MRQKLTEKQRVFVREYAKCLNGTEAARRAGYQGTYDSLRAIASENLKKRSVREAVDASLSEGQKARNEATRHKKRVKVYLIRAENGLVKIGKTANIESRFSTLNHASPIDLELVHVFDTLFGDELEEELHALYDDRRIKGEWFRLSDQDVREIIRRYG